MKSSKLTAPTVTNNAPYMFGDRLAALRKASGRSQEEMAQELGVSRSGYQYYERNERDLPSALLLKICQLLDDDPSRLLTGAMSALPLDLFPRVEKAVAEKIEARKLNISHEKKWRVIKKVINDIYKRPDGPSFCESYISEIDGLLDLVL